MYIHENLLAIKLLSLQTLHAGTSTCWQFYGPTWTASSLRHIWLLETQLNVVPAAANGGNLISSECCQIVCYHTHFWTRDRHFVCVLWDGGRSSMLPIYEFTGWNSVPAEELRTHVLLNRYEVFHCLLSGFLGVQGLLKARASCTSPVRCVFDANHQAKTIQPSL